MTTQPDPERPPVPAPSAASETVVSPERLRSFVRRVVQAAGLSAEDAAITADAMVWAELRGIDGLGVAKLPLCVASIRAGGTRAAARPVTIRATATTALVDAQNAWGQVAGVRAMRLALERARSSGIGLVVVRNSNSAIAMGYYPMLAVADRMIGLAITNSMPLLAPWGGISRVIGNQAYAIGCPARRHFPLLFDTSNAAISRAKVRSLQERGARLPPGVALNARGEATVDPAAALEGLLLPVGGHRGYGLAVMWEVLTGVLAGGPRFGPGVGSVDAPDDPQGVSLFLLAIDPEVFIPLEAFLERVDRLIDQLHTAARAPGVERIYAPGEQGFLRAAAREREGIPLAPERVAELRALGARLGVAW